MLFYKKSEIKILQNNNVMELKIQQIKIHSHSNYTLSQIPWCTIFSKMYPNICNFDCTQNFTQSPLKATCSNFLVCWIKKIAIFNEITQEHNQSDVINWTVDKNNITAIVFTGWLHRYTKM